MADLLCPECEHSARAASQLGMWLARVFHLGARCQEIVTEESGWPIGCACDHPSHAR